jgi:hypothetical protein
MHAACLLAEKREDQELLEREQAPELHQENLGGGSESVIRPPMQIQRKDKGACEVHGGQEAARMRVLAIVRNAIRS